MKNFLNLKTVQSFIVTILIIVLSVLFIQALSKAGREQGYDFTSYLLTSKALLNGENPYLTASPFLFKYPLFLGVLLIPFTFLPYLINNIFWFILNIGLFVFVTYLLLNFFYSRNPQKNELITTLFLAFLILFSPIQNHMLNGQVNFIVLFFCTAFIFYLDKNQWLASFFLAMAISIKIVPIIFIFLLIIERKHLAVITVISFTALFTVIIPFLFTGPLLWEYYNHFLNHFVFNPILASPDLNSESRYFTLFGFLNAMPGIDGQGGVFLQIYSSVCILILIIFLHLITRKSIWSQKKLILYSIYSIAMLLLSPSSQPHHLVFIIPALFLIIINFYERSFTQNKFIYFYFWIFFIVFWAGNIFRATPLTFLSIFSLFFIILLGYNKLKLTPAANN